MNFESFTKEIKSRLSDFLPEELKQTEIVERSILKNNGIQLRGIMLNDSKGISPTVYMEGFYQKYQRGSKMEDILKEIASIYQDNMKMDIPSAIRDFTYETVKDKIYIAVCNAEKNAELLQNVPHELREDLVLTYRILVESENGTMGSALIHHNHLQQWGVSEDTLKAGAWDSTRKSLPAVFSSMTNVINELVLELPEEMLEELPPEYAMYVLTNEQKMQGAAYMFDREIMDQIAQRLGSNLIILPSSTHEIIILPENEEMNLQELKNMVSEVNSTQLAEEDILSDEIYRYDSASHTLHMVEGLEQSKGMNFSM